jgi:hypothetical protein
MRRDLSAAGGGFSLISDHRSLLIVCDWDTVLRP